MCESIKNIEKKFHEQFKDFDLEAILNDDSYEYPDYEKENKKAREILYKAEHGLLDEPVFRNVVQ